MKFVEEIIARPLRSSIIYSVIMVAMVWGYGIYSLIAREAALGSNTMSIPVNLFIATFVITTAIFFAAVGRFYVCDVVWRRVGGKRSITFLFVSTEFIGFLLLLNLLFSGVTSGAAGTAGLLLIGGIGAFLATMFGLAALVLWLTLERPEIRNAKSKISSFKDSFTN